MKKILYTLAAVATLFTACNKDEGTPEVSDNVPVQFSTTITKAAGTTWNTTDQIGVFMMNTGTPLTTARLADNVMLSTTNGTDFTLASPIYYPQSGAVDFVAYYPYQASLATSYIYNVDVSTQTNPANIDLLYSNNATNKSRSTPTVELTFEHKLSKVVLNIGAGAGITDLSGLTVKIAGMPTKADFALTGGTLSNLTAIANITPITIGTTTNFDATLAAIVIPQAGTSGRTIVFTLGGQEYTYTIDNTDDFLSGKTHTYNITIKKSGVTASRGEIRDWEDTSSIAGDLGEAKQIPIQMVFIPAGTFQMGSPNTDGQAYDDEKPQHYVKLTKDFYMGKYEVTFAQYDAFCDATIGNEKPGDNGWGRGNRPVINVTWNDAMTYCTWLSEQTGQTWRLPTEAEWEYACRAGKTTIYSYEDTADGNYMWYSSNSGSQTHEVGTKLPNTWGLYDMHGNVFEWCLDQWDGSSNYPTAATEASAVENPLVTAGSGRVLRGGGWDNYAQYCRSAYRGSDDPDFARSFFGFRVVLVP